MYIQIVITLLPIVCHLFVAAQSIGSLPGETDPSDIYMMEEVDMEQTSNQTSHLDAAPCLSMSSDQPDNQLPNQQFNRDEVTMDGLQTARDSGHVQSNGNSTQQGWYSVNSICILYQHLYEKYMILIFQLA